MSSQGVLDLIGGNMYSGKSTELSRRLAVEAVDEKARILYLNTILDTRSSSNFSTHNPLLPTELPSNIVSRKVSLLSEVSDIQSFDVIGVDEAQFFSDLYPQVKKWVDEYRKHVIIAGLDGSFRREAFRGESFGNILDLIPISDTYTKLQARCMRCINLSPPVISNAPFTYHLESSRQTSTRDIGGKGKYIAVCRDCYLKLSCEEVSR
jgi:thymidine kinase